jgi:uncharacterized protein YdiU (UPF0061 family)
LLSCQRAKLGLQRVDGRDDADDARLADHWLALLHTGRVDFTLAWRRLADAAAGDEAPLRALFSSSGAPADAPDAWLERWRERCARDDEGAAPTAVDGANEARAKRMRSVNPWIIPRNHRVEEALAAASDADDLGPFERLLDALRSPYEDTAENVPYAEPATPDVTASYRTFCGT